MHRFKVIYVLIVRILETWNLVMLTKYYNLAMCGDHGLIRPLGNLVQLNLVTAEWKKPLKKWNNFLVISMACFDRGSCYMLAVGKNYQTSGK